MSTTFTNISLSVLMNADLAFGDATGSIRTSPTPFAPVIGTSAGQADIFGVKTFSVTSGTPLDIDLTSFADDSGATFVFAHLLALLLENTTVSGGNLTIGGGSNPVWASADPKLIGPNDWVAAKLAVEVLIDGTHKIFRVSASAGTLTGKLRIIGRST